MTECESMLKELEEKATRLASAAKAAKAPGASEREISDCKMIEQEYMGLHKRTKPWSMTAAQTPTRRSWPGSNCRRCTKPSRSGPAGTTRH